MHSLFHAAFSHREYGGTYVVFNEYNCRATLAQSCLGVRPPRLTRGKKTIIPFKNKYKLTCELNKTKKSGNLRPFPNFNKFINSKLNNSNFRDDCTESLLKMADTFRPIVLLAVYFIHYSLAGQE